MKNCPGCSREIDRYSIACQYCGRLVRKEKNLPIVDIGELDSPGILESRTLTISIDCDSKKICKFASNLANLPKWAVTFAKSAKKSKGSWIVETEQGPFKIRMAKKNTFGILDHYVKPQGAPEFLVPMRVVANAQGSEVIFTLFQLPGMTEENFKRDIGLVEKDLNSLKFIMEKQ